MGVLYLYRTLCKLFIYLRKPCGNCAADALDVLNKRNIDFLISYDGCCGTRQYGNDLPKELECKKILLDAGLSSQATLLGKREVTYEALYVSKGLSNHFSNSPEQLLLLEAI